MQKISIIGSGFSSLSSACYLAQKGYNVHVFEKNDTIGGRARVMKIDGFTFDMGPSWYWMPDVFESFFNDFGKQVSDFYELEKLSPAYRVYFEEGDFIDIPDNLAGIYQIFEEIEQGSSLKLELFLRKAEFNYKVAMGEVVYKPGFSPLELISKDTILRVGQFFKSIRREIRRNFKNPKLIKILEFPVLFLGATPQKTPMFYNFMNYADFSLGTWYPKGGMNKIVNGMEKLALDLGVNFHLNSNVSGIEVENNRTKGITVNGTLIESDIVVSGADYHHTESLLPELYRNYSSKFWSKKIMSPSSLLFYVGFDKKLDNILHHILFFDQDFDIHADEIYTNPAWPKNPLFYANFTSATDSTVSPEGKEIGFFLIPLAPDLEDTPELREKYFNMIIERFEKHTNQEVSKHILFKKSYCILDFKKDYNSFKGNAYGMANTLFQTGFMRPKIKNKKIKNLYYTGQLTVPGPGVPPTIISGKVVANQVIKENNISK